MILSILMRFLVQDYIPFQAKLGSYLLVNALLLFSLLTHCYICSSYNTSFSYYTPFRAALQVYYSRTVFTKSVKNRLESLEAAQGELKVKLLQAQIEKDVLTKGKVIFYLKQFRKLDLLKLENKQALVDNLKELSCISR